MTAKPLKAATGAFLMVLAAGLLPLALAAEAVDPPVEVISDEAAYDLIRRLQAPERKVRRQAAESLIALDDETLVPGLVDAVFFTPRERRRPIFEVLAALTGEEWTGYYDWVEYVGSREDLEPRSGYLQWKASQLARIDDRYPAIFYPGAPSQIRLAEVVSGGVALEGIPSVDEPRMISAAEAVYLKKDEKVFGVELDGETRAYPVRVLSWHEMLNDTIAGRPVTLSYCTLCGSAILYDTRTASGGRHTFGTSGLLYRSNKLMVDRETLTLWSNLTGKPVIGRLARSPLALPVLPMTLSTWQDWRTRHPETLTVDLEPLTRIFSARFGFDYRPGAADRARAGVSFPVWRKDDRLDRRTEIYALLVDGRPKAYPIDVVLKEQLINDTIGERPVVVIGDQKSGAVRVYARGEHRFSRSAEGSVVDAEGRSWVAGEQALVDEGGAGRLERLAGHSAYWFGWYAFYPDTALYVSPGRDS